MSPGLATSVGSAWKAVDVLLVCVNIGPGIAGTLTATIQINLNRDGVVNIVFISSVLLKYNHVNVCVFKLGF